MNKFLLVLILLTVQSAVRAQSGQGFVITGKLESAENGKIIFIYRDPVSNNKLVFDSVECRDGNFEISSSMPDDQAVILVLHLVGSGFPSGDHGPVSPPLRLFVRNGDKITVNGNASDLEWADVKGDLYNDQFNQLKAATKEDKMAMKDAGDQWAKDNYNQEGKEQLMKMGEALQEKQLAFARQHPDYLVSSLLLAIDTHPTAGQREQIFAAFTPEVKKGQYGRLIQQQIDEEKKSGTGATSIGFTKLDMTGKPVSLSDYKGKYVLLDFWGSWCGPCRMGNPHLKELYARYKSKGFTIIGIANEQGPSLEADIASWKKAVEQDGLPWIQVLNNEGIDKCDVTDLYNVQAFPTKILIDPDGKIIGRFMGTASSPTEKDELTGKLNEVMGM